MPILGENVPLAEFCTFGAGGMAKFLSAPSEISEVQAIVKLRNKEGVPVLFLGGGSNVLVSDIDGMVVLSRNFCGIDWQTGGDEIVVEVGSGYSLKKLVRESLLLGVSGLEFAVGIPGSVGGAVVGNAGTRDFDFGKILAWVECVEPDGTVKKILANDIESRYRFSSIYREDRFLTKCALKLKKSSADAVRERCKENWLRRAKQPFNAKSAGCIFKNPPGDFAGRLLDECGCKGMRIGGAEVSPLHANFFINLGNASVRDIKSLIEKCRDIVFEKKGILLELEVKIFGF